jgi:hypothetical protein
VLVIWNIYSGDASHTGFLKVPDYLSHDKIINLGAAYALDQYR